jgi:hypothetical protein
MHHGSRHWRILHGYSLDIDDPVLDVLHYGSSERDNDCETTNNNPPSQRLREHGI